MRLLKSEITGRDREQIGCITSLSLPSPPRRSEVKLAAQSSPSLENRQLYRGERCYSVGFWSLESSWQCDIKAVSRLLLAANYIKQPRRFGFQNQNPLLPFFFFFPFLATSLRWGFFFFLFVMRRSTAVQETVDNLAKKKNIKDASDSETAR